MPAHGTILENSVCMNAVRIYQTGQFPPAGPSEKKPDAPKPAVPAEEDIIADGSAGAFEATEVVSEDDLYPQPSPREKNGKDHY